MLKERIKKKNSVLIGLLLIESYLKQTSCSSKVSVFHLHCPPQPSASACRASKAFRILCLPVWLRATPIASSSHSHTLHIHTRTHTRQPFRIVPHIRADSEYTHLARIHALPRRIENTHTHWYKASGAALVICCDGRIQQATSPLFVS